MKKYIKTVLLVWGVSQNTMYAEETLTPNELHATMSIVTSYILEGEVIYFNGKSYETVTSPYTGRVWLDRNLGANRACTALDDAQCYGDYYQWGRRYDGHQDRNSSVSNSQATNITIAGQEFITSVDDWAAVDYSAATRLGWWASVDGDYICPKGYRVPTLSELQAELLDPNSAEITGNVDAFNSFLKLPSAGNRDGITAGMTNEGTAGLLWVNTKYVKPAKSYYLFFDASGAYDNPLIRSHGLSVRCIKD